jgi:iron complex transport system substrate-binding protein
MLDLRYADFKAFKSGNMYNNTLVCNEKGYSNYWESGIVYPDKILSDLINIFHPTLQENIHFNFYKKLRD